jgi:hypothetical protein
MPDVGFLIADNRKNHIARKEISEKIKFLMLVRSQYFKMTTGGKTLPGNKCGKIASRKGCRRFFW